MPIELLKSHTHGCVYFLHNIFWVGWSTVRTSLAALNQDAHMLNIKSEDGDDDEHKNAHDIERNLSVPLVPV